FRRATRWTGPPRIRLREPRRTRTVGSQTRRVGNQERWDRGRALRLGPFVPRSRQRRAGVLRSPWMTAGALPRSLGAPDTVHPYLPLRAFGSSNNALVRGFAAIAIGVRAERRARRCFGGPRCLRARLPPMPGAQQATSPVTR